MGTVDNPADIHLGHHIDRFEIVAAIDMVHLDHCYTGTMIASLQKAGVVH